MKYALRVLWGFDFIIWLAARWQVVVDAVIFNRRGYTQKKLKKYSMDFMFESTHLVQQTLVIFKLIESHLWTWLDFKFVVLHISTFYFEYISESILLKLLILSFLKSTFFRSVLIMADKC